MNTKKPTSLRQSGAIGMAMFAATVLLCGPLQAQPTSRPAHPRPIRFIPNVHGAPSNLGTATSRGRADDPYLAASVIGPQDHEGLTTQESPSIFWYTTKPTADKVEVTIVKADDLQDVKPLLKITFRDPFAAGLQRLDLAKAGVKLASDVRYKWSVSIIDSEGRSGDIVSQAIIRRIAPPAGVAQAIDPFDRARVYGEAGIWYDLFSTLSDAIDAAPGDTLLRQQRANLLDQVGLPALPKELKSWAKGAAPK